MKSKKIGIAFLSNVLNTETFNFGLEIEKKLKIPVYFVNDSYYLPEVISEDPKFNPKNIISIDDNICFENGYINCMITGKQINTVLAKTPIAYDKMLYYFCEQNKEIDFIFCFEDDVFIPSIETIENLINNYSNYDLVTPNNFKKEDNVMDWHWKNIVDKIEAPYYYSMVSAIGISRNLFNCIQNYVSKNKTLFFTEVMFNTLAMQNSLKVTDCFEFKSIVWLGNWNLDEFLLLPNNVFHPIKDLQSYGYYRNLIDKKRNSKFKPKNKLPDFIKNLM